jgi:hypothetical protein
MGSTEPSNGIVDNLARVRRAIDSACQRAGRDTATVRLIAVSKGQPPAAIREAWSAGLRDFGENYVQELVAKARELEDLPGIRWHFIGHLQRNKAKDVAGIARIVHTIDRVELAIELEKRATQTIDVLVEVNLCAEPQKSGVAPDAVAQLVESLTAMQHLRPVGLMAIPPATEEQAASRAPFRALREIRDRVRAAGSPTLTELSMGMSGDFEVAIEEGATLVRVGTAIFGARPVKERG